MIITLQRQVNVMEVTRDELLSLEKNELADIIGGLLREKVTYNPFGVKRSNASSKYYYVSKQGKWWFAQMMEKGKVILCKKFDREIEAAREVDTYLDSIGDNKRPRNRDAFPGLMHLNDDTAEHGIQDDDDDDDERDLDAEVAEAFAEAAPKAKAYHPVGIKQGKTSDYHYVYQLTRNKMWIGRIGDVEVYHGRDEVAAAVAVDDYLDEIKDLKRPRNRNEFPEVMELHNYEHKAFMHAKDGMSE